MSTPTFKAYLTGFTVGSLMATAVTLLYAPRSGEKTRKLLQNRKEEVQEKTQKFIKQTRQDANKMLNRKATEAIDEASALLNHGQEFLDSARQQVEGEEMIS
jgi:gas vesicle protein